MEIIKRGSQGPHKFKILRPFWWAGKLMNVGESIEIKNQTEADGMVLRGQIVPEDLPKIGVYVTLRKTTLPGKVEKFEAKPLELVELKADDALALMIQGFCIPKDDGQWRPRNAHLKTEKTRK